MKFDVALSSANIAVGSRISRDLSSPGVRLDVI